MTNETTTRYAAIGTDGNRPVVWGIGASEDAAEQDAHEELRAGDCESALVYCEITAEDAARVEAGDVDATAILERNPAAFRRLANG